MSSPARQLPSARQGNQRTPASGGAEAHRRAQRGDRAERPQRSEAPRTATRRRAKHRLGFAVLASALVGSIVFGIVVLNVLLAQASFHIDEVERRIETLSAAQVDLVREQATLSAPGRIAHWASRHGMRLPDDIRILHASGRTGVDPAGADPSSDEADGAEAASP